MVSVATRPTRATHSVCSPPQPKSDLFDSAHFGSRLRVLVGRGQRVGAANSVCSPPPCGEGLAVGVVVRNDDMSAADKPRVWAKRDRTIVPPQRRLARAMRAVPTEAERKLWWHLRHRISTPGTHLRRQVRIGRYIADFVCHAKRIIIEVDGGQHGSSAADEQRTKVLEANGYRMLRYWNNDVLSNIDGVLDDILSELATTPTPNPSPPQVGPARLAHSNAKPGQARVSWGGERTEQVASGYAPGAESKQAVLTRAGVRRAQRGAV
jgi:very-short-patch-repair endonuclease